MAEQFNAKASFELEVQKAIKQANSLTDAIVNIGDAAESTVPGLSKLEKQSVAITGGLGKLSGESNKVADAQSKVARATKEAEGNIITQRYALYDVATTWGAVSAALLGTAIASAKLSADYQRSFADVIRTTEVTGGVARKLRTDLIDLTTEIPSSFDKLAQIASLGGQMGIAAGDIADFTEVVAKLVATAEGLDEQSAGLFLGRFSALAGVASKDFEALASSLLKVGVNSLASEKEIVAISTNIVSMGNYAGLSADQIVALSSALASTGTAPELSRGTVTRLFTLMSAAISEGGERLENFARISGMTADQFARSWGSPEFGNTLINFFEGLSTRTSDANAALQQLGISSVRDKPALLKLADSGKMVADQFRDAADGMNDATEISDQFGIIVNTVSERLTILINTLKGVVAEGNNLSTGPLAGLIGILQGIAEGLLAIARNPAAQWFITTATAVSVLVGAFAAFKSMQALATASMLAMQVAQTALTKTGGANVAVLRGLSGAMLTMTVGTTRATAAQLAYNKALDAGLGRLAALRAGLAAGATAATGLAGALRGIGIATGVGAAFALLASVLSTIGTNAAEAKTRIEEVTATLDAQTGAITENTIAWANSQLISSEAARIYKNMGGDVTDLTGYLLGNAEAIERVNTLLADKDAETAWVTLFGTFGGMHAGVNTIRTTLDDLATAIARGADEAKLASDINKQYAGTTDDLSIALKDMLDIQWEAIGASVDMQNALFALGQSIQANGTSFDEYSAGGRANLTALQKVLSAMVTAAAGDASQLATLVAGLMEALTGFGVNAANQLGFVQSFLAQIVGSGGFTGFKGLEAATLDAGNAMRQGFSSGAQKAAKSAKSVAKEVRTLTDYVRDLSSVFDNAFGIRFGLDQAIDGVADAFQGLVDYSDSAADAVRDAAQAVVDADARIKGLKAARSTLEYQLRVAREYGDLLRANEIVAELAENNADLSKEQANRTKSEKDLQKAQDATSKSLDGTTEASREQRAAVLDLVKAYQDQIVALANSGLSQDEVRRRTQQLRDEFIRQLTQMGYNRAEVDKYAKAFDDFATIVQKMPKNITVSVNSNPALRALDEYIAKINSAKTATDNLATAAGNLSRQTVAPTYDNAASNKQMRRYQLELRILDLKQQIGAFYAQGQRVRANPLLRELNYLVNRLNSGSYAAGGFTGRGGKYEPAGVVHRGEYVIPAHLVNQSTGLPYANALHNLAATSGSTTNNYYNGGYVNAPTGQIQLVELLPHQLNQIVQSVSSQLSIDGRVIAETANHQNVVAARRGSN